jgi:hypothetical protein
MQHNVLGLVQFPQIIVICRSYYFIAVLHGQSYLGSVYNTDGLVYIPI